MPVLRFLGRALLKGLDAYGDAYINLINSILYGDSQGGGR